MNPRITLIVSAVLWYSLALNFVRSRSNKKEAEKNKLFPYAAKALHALEPRLNDKEALLFCNS
jgi:hypothetical protein